MLKKIKHHFIFVLSIFFCLLVVPLCSNAGQSDKVQPIFRPNYIGLEIAYANFNYNNSYLNPFYRATRFDYNSGVAFQLLLGHYFVPYFALQLGLMRPLIWTRMIGINGVFRYKTSIWTNMLHFDARGRLPLGAGFSLLGDVGVAVVSRHGAYDPGRPIITDRQTITPLVGGGVDYAITDRWYIGWRANYTFQQSGKQPAIFYTGVNVDYHFGGGPSQDENASTKYNFPKQELEVGGFTSSVFNFPIAEHVPFFWSGKVKTSSALMLTYRRMFYHSEKYFSFDWGASAQRVVGSMNRQVIYGLTIYPDVRFWFLRCNWVDMYLTVSVAAPTYISRRFLGGRNLGAHFTFYDYAGLGAFLGTSKRVDIGLQVGHYSNGNIFPQNPGIEIPLTVHLGVAF